MSYYNFRNVSGIDNQIDRNEYNAYQQITHPYTDPYTNARHANQEFNLVDRNRNGKIDYNEFADAEQRKNGYYPGNLTSGYSYGNYSYRY